MNLSPGAYAPSLQRACASCRAAYRAKRATSRFCSTACRMRSHRRAQPIISVTGHLPHCYAKDEFSEVPTDPQWIYSTHTARRFPTSYAEHGLPYPDYLRVRPRH